MKALLIRSPWIEKILSGEKTWELRGSKTKIRGEVALIRSGSGQVVGVCDLVDVEGLLSLAELKRTSNRHCVPTNSFRHGSRYKKTYAWVLKDAKPLGKPVAYDHPQGAVIWVNLDVRVIRKIRRKLRR